MLVKAGREELEKDPQNNEISYSHKVGVFIGSGRQSAPGWQPTAKVQPGTQSLLCYPGLSSSSSRVTSDISLTGSGVTADSCH